jgi:hypothetical protein
VVDLPLGITEDWLLGTIDHGKASKTGEKHCEPGLLARLKMGVLPYNLRHLIRQFYVWDEEVKRSMP